MPAILGPAAQRLRADTAGLTHVSEGPPPGAPVAATFREITAALPSEHGGGLHHLFSDSIPTLVSTDIIQPTASVIGRHGGLKPVNEPGTHPGPGTMPGLEIPVGEGWGSGPTGWVPIPPIISPGELPASPLPGQSPPSTWIPLRPLTPSATAPLSSFGSRVARNASQIFAADRVARLRRTFGL
jgi:hypothetical protein